MDPTKIPLPTRDPAAIGEHLEANLHDAHARFEDEQQRWLATARRRVTPDNLKLAREKLNALTELRHHGAFFGYLRVAEGDANTPRAWRIGRAHYPDLGIVSWRHAIGRLFYELEPGDDYDRDGANGDLIEGEIVARAVLEADGPNLHAARWNDPEGTLSLRRADDGFIDADASPATSSPIHSTTPTSPTRHGLGDILAYITPEQYRLIAAATDRPLIIQGKAGSGKTTVALHRVSWLATPDDEQRPSTIAVERVLVVMFNKALCSFVDTMLKPLGLQAATVKTFHGWALDAVRTVYRGELEVTALQTTPQKTASRLKAQLGVLRAVDAYVTAQTDRMVAYLHDKLATLGALDWLRRFDEASGPVLPRLMLLRREARAAASTDPLAPTLLDLFNNVIRRMQRYKEDLYALLTDHDLLTTHLPDASPADLKTLAAYQADLQRDRAGRTGRRVDFDDLGILLRLIQVKNGGLPLRSEEETFHYDHLVVDEAQDFGALPLKVLLDAVRTRAGVTIVGDVNQKILPDINFIGWDAIARELGIDGADVARLEVGHRSTAPIMRLTDAIAADPPASTGRPGEPPLDLVCPDPDHTHRAIADALRDRHREHPDAHQCVVCKNKDAATQLLLALKPLLPDLPLRLGHNDDFTFAPGVTVSTRRQIKGLEFDTVIVHDPDPMTFRDTNHGRCELYVACSRARDRLLFIGHSPRSPILERLVRDELLQRRFATPPILRLDDDELPF